jgi:hypothetical protein
MMISDKVYIFLSDNSNITEKVNISDNGSNVMKRKI